MRRRPRLQKNDFTVVLPIRGTDKELQFMDKSIPSAIRLNPGELIFATDEPVRTEVVDKIKAICAKHNFTDFEIFTFPRDDSWGFQLANVIWHCYHLAKYDRIFSFDIDSIVRDNIMSGYDIVGKDNVAVCSFTKKLRIKSYAELQRYIFYRMRVRQSDYVFSGIYWIYRPFFFDVIKEDEYKKIINGVDTFLTNEVRENGKYKIVTLKSIGCDCLDVQNEDYPWRQFQTGVWIFANQQYHTRGQLFRKMPSLRNIKNFRLKYMKSIVRYILFTPLFMISGPKSFVIVKAFMYCHPHLIQGYMWAQKHNQHEAVNLAKTMTYDEWGYNGGKIIQSIGVKFKRTDGTGFQ